jgi:hypothetical protein
MYDLDFTDDGGSIRGNKKTTEMVDDQFVPALLRSIT